jgi:cell division protein FtsL
MKMKVYEVVQKIRDIDSLIDKNENDDATVEMLTEYRDSILDTTVDI